ncbi:MAG: acyltransferase [Bacteroidetes bacterium]|nr:acyltransferase [Bacteroidota bacterium]
MDPFNSRFILNEDRWPWIDYDKGISIILVGYGHCYGSLMGYNLSLSSFSFFNYFNVFFFGFRMPLFFIVSGMLVSRSFSKKGPVNYIADRINNILHPLMVWGILEITLQMLLTRFTHLTSYGHIGPKTYLYLLIDPGKTGHFWYLNALFSIGVLYVLLKSVLRLKAIVQVIIGVVFYCVSAYIHVNDINGGILGYVFEYYIFFALGDLVSIIMLDKNNREKFSSWKTFFPLIIMFAFLQYYCARLILQNANYGMYYVERKLPFLFLAEALVGCTVSLNFSFLLQRYGIFKFLRVVGFHSLFIYCMQIIVMQVARIFFMSALHITYVPALILLVWSSGVVLPVFIYNYCMKHGMWWLYTFRKPERQVEYLRYQNIFRPKRFLDRQRLRAKQGAATRPMTEEVLD